jgi:hypothetical protein
MQALHGPKFREQSFEQSNITKIFAVRGGVLADEECLSNAHRHQPTNLCKHLPWFPRSK